MILEDYFTEDRIVRWLCRRRIELARQRRRDHFISGLAGESVSGDIDNIYSMLPPRRVWHKIRPNAAQRKHGQTDGAAYMARRLAGYAISELNAIKPRYRWSEELKDFLNDVRNTALNWNPTTPFSHDRLFAVPKDKPGNGQKYRVITTYSPKSTAIAGGFSAYIRDTIDPALSAECLAFRPSQVTGQTPPSHHDAVSKIIGYNKSVAKRLQIWCGECDIQGFFDSVSHDIARDQLQLIFGQLGANCDDRFLHFLESYLLSYDFADMARLEASQWLKAKGIHNAVLPDPRRYLEQSSITIPSGKIGIPQGSYLSCIIANAVLHEADQECIAIIDRRSDPSKGMYLRYCDDILICNTRKKNTEYILESYINVLRKLRLPYHEPLPFNGYSKKFWKNKSKNAYPWHYKSKREAVPWLGFVGYQIKRDGTIRVRQQSIYKELKKQKTAASDYFKRVDKRISRRPTAGQKVEITSSVAASYRMMMHLVAIGVGYPEPYGTQPAKNGINWANGFRGLHEGIADTSGLRRLDSGRTAILKSFKYRISSLVNNGQVYEKKKSVNIGDTATYHLHFSGFPFSYFRQFNIN